MVAVGDIDIDCGGHYDGNVYHPWRRYDLPGTARDFIEAFDGGLPVEPFEFEFEIEPFEFEFEAGS